MNGISNNTEYCIKNHKNHSDDVDDAKPEGTVHLYGSKSEFHTILVLTVLYAIGYSDANTVMFYFPKTSKAIVY